MGEGSSSRIERKGSSPSRSLKGALEESAWGAFEGGAELAWGGGERCCDRDGCSEKGDST